MTILNKINSAFWLLLSFVALYFAGSIWIDSHSLVSNVLIPFDTDEADHANAALELAFAIKSLNFSQIVDSITRQSFYPPFHSFFVAAYYLVLQPSLPASRFFSIWSLLPCIITFSVAVYKPWNKTANFKNFFQIVAVSSVLFIANEVFLENATLCMLEILGVLLVCCILWAATINDSSRRSVLLALLCFLLFITKYSFAILVVPGVWLALLLYKNNFIKFNFIFFGLCLAWLLAIDLESFKAFLFGHPSYAPLLSSDNLLFDFRSWFFKYHTTVWLASITTLLTLLGSVRAIISFPILLALLAGASSFGILLLSTTNEIRHIIVAVPCFWYIALSFIYAKNSDTLMHKILNLALFIAIIHSAYTFYPNARSVVIVGMEGKPSYHELIKFTVDNIDPNLPTLVVGNTDQISIEGIQWYGAIAANKPYTEIKFDSYPFLPHKVQTAQRRKRNASQWFYDESIPRNLPELLSHPYYKQIMIYRKIGVKDKTATLIKEFTDLSIDKNKKMIRKTFHDYEGIVIYLDN